MINRNTPTVWGKHTGARWKRDGTPPQCGDGFDKLTVR